jgi:DNA helicase-2/ATP-dependent DNA helicase PcrA
MAGPSLAAIVIAKLLEKGASDSELLAVFLNALYEHIRGRNGDKPQSVVNLSTADSIQKFLATGKISGKNKKRTIDEAERIIALTRNLKFSGEPAADWGKVRNLLNESICPTIQQVAQDAIYLRLLRRGAILNSGLASLWKSTGSYLGATRLVRTSLVQDHFSGGTAIWKGIHVMTIHKSKGKEFDEVIIYEGVYGDRIARSENGTPEFNQSKLALRVGVTRAVRQSTIISPSADICPFL